MMNTVFPIVCAVLILAKYVAQIWLERLNQRHVGMHAKEVPAAFQEAVTPENDSLSPNHKCVQNSVVLKLMRLRSVGGDAAALQHPDHQVGPVAERANVHRQSVGRTET